MAALRSEGAAVATPVRRFSIRAPRQTELANFLRASAQLLAGARDAPYRLLPSMRCTCTRISIVPETTSGFGPSVSVRELWGSTVRI